MLAAQVHLLGTVAILSESSCLVSRRTIAAINSIDSNNSREQRKDRKLHPAESVQLLSCPVNSSLDKASLVTHLTDRHLQITTVHLHPRTSKLLPLVQGLPSIDLSLNARTLPRYIPYALSFHSLILWNGKRFVPSNHFQAKITERRRNEVNEKRRVARSCDSGCACR